MQFDFTNTPQETDIDTLYQGLVKFNKSHCDVEEKEIACYVRDEENNIIGGLYGINYSNTLFIKYLWVSEQHRHQHMGRQLMSQAENYAREHGITDLYLDTFSFQAPKFYEQLGFERVGQYTGYPTKGVDRIFFQKHISEE